MPTDHKESLRHLIKQHDAAYCMACGKCSSVCPVASRETRNYESPRMLVESMLDGAATPQTPAPLLWSCLTCARCEELCPSEVRFVEFIRDVRHLAAAENQKNACTHGEMMETWARLMADPTLSQNRLEWLTPDLEISDTSDTLYFTGCLPLLDQAFKDLDFEGISITRAGVKILNHLGIAPRVLEDERCCGHDRLFQGDRETFGRLARLNMEKFKSGNIKRIVTTCPECARTLKLDYPELVENHGIPVLHVTELLHEHLSRFPLSDSASNHTVTFHDPCRLGRHLGVYEAPREVLSHFGATPLEMAAYGKKSLCCGTTCWTSCGQVSKQIQTERLQQVSETGADMLVTACPKCQIHMKCAQNDPELKADLNMPIQDITTWVAERLQGK